MAGKGLTLSTFGGNPTSTAASLGTIEALEEGAARRASPCWAIACAGMDRLWEKYPLIGDVRQRAHAGHRNGDGPPMRAGAQGRGATLRGTRARPAHRQGGLYSNVIRIAPPATVSRNRSTRRWRF